MKSDPDLWKRIQAYQLDDPDAAFPFTQRLAQDNNWTHPFARRVIEEYKRFVYLCCISDAQLTPSDEVDQAWHLHLTYSRDYWGPFQETLGRPLHHGPTRGGREQFETFKENYERTLTLYENEFGRRPPSSVWPTVDLRFHPKFSRRRVNISNRVIINTSLVTHTLLAIILLPLLVIVALPEITALGSTENGCDATGSCLRIALSMVRADYLDALIFTGAGVFVAYLASIAIVGLNSGSNNPDSGLTFEVSWRGNGEIGGGCSGGGGGGCSGCGD